MAAKDTVINGEYRYSDGGPDRRDLASPFDILKLRAATGLFAIGTIFGVPLITFSRISHDHENTPFYLAVGAVLGVLGTIGTIVTNKNVQYLKSKNP